MTWKQIIARFTGMKRMIFPHPLREHAFLLKGEYHSWAEARDNSFGYEDADLVERVATHNKVREDLGERGFLLGDRELQILSALMVAANHLSKRDLEIIDIGGELGGYYRSLSRFFSQNLNWTVLETEAMASKGNELFSTTSLSFTHDETILSKRRDQLDIILASGVLQCLQNPAVFFEQICEANAPYIIVSVLPLITKRKDILTCRLVKTDSYEESYPLWIFSKARWIEILQHRYVIMYQWQVSKSDTLSDGTTVNYSGFLLERKPIIEGDHRYGTNEPNETRSHFGGR